MTLSEPELGLQGHGTFQSECLKTMHFILDTFFIIACLTQAVPSYFLPTG